jgi:hypothetical protein
MSMFLFTGAAAGGDDVGVVIAYMYVTLIIPRICHIKLRMLCSRNDMIQKYLL